MSALKAGVKVRIYQKPFTHEEFEGEAVLVKPIRDQGEGLECWMVQFPGCEPCPRWTDVSAIVS